MVINKYFHDFNLHVANNTGRRMDSCGFVQNSILSQQNHFCLAKLCDTDLFYEYFNFVMTKFIFVDKIHFCHDRSQFCQKGMQI